MVSVLPRAFDSGSKRHSPRTVRTPATRREARKDVVSVLSASSLRPSLSILEMMDPAPCPNMNPKAWNTAWMLMTTPTAAAALVPRMPTK